MYAHPTRHSPPTETTDRNETDTCKKTRTLAQPIRHRWQRLGLDAQQSRRRVTSKSNWASDSWSLKAHASYKAMLPSSLRLADFTGCLALKGSGKVKWFTFIYIWRIHIYQLFLP